MNKEHDHQENQKMRDRVVSAIHRREINMRPRWHFVLRAALIATGAVIAFLALLFFVSFVIYALWHSGAWYVPIFGMRGVIAFLISVPWLLVAISAIFIIILEILVTKYSFAHRKPLLYSVLAIVGVSILGGFVVARTTFHARVFRAAEANDLPLISPFYRGFGRRAARVNPGVIESLMANGFILDNARGETSTVFIIPETRLPFGADFAEGDFVVVFGDRANGRIEAIGIRKIAGEPPDDFWETDAPYPMHFLKTEVPLSTY